MAQKKEWKEVTGNMSMWNNKDIKEGDEIEGVYKALRENVGPNKSNVYEIETADGVVGVWGGTVVDGRMAEVKLGSEVKIVYRGEKMGKRGNTFKDYGVFVSGASESDEVLNEALK